jgi:asparagine synthase (glutamine-hydrolysing)
MCGICGSFSLGGASEEGERVESMSALMRRRGPDDDGFWTDGTHATFGFRRLSIIDLSRAGHQPMLSDCGRYALVFNGEVYNFREIRRDLEGRGERFHSATDSEVVLHALMRWGWRALVRFNGMFALGFFDAVEKTLLLARDPMGIKPLYYYTHSGGLIFASQYDQLLHHPACDRTAVDSEALGLYLRLAYMPAPYGVIRGTHQLPAGHYLTVSPRRAPSVHGFYDFPQASEPYLTGSEAVDAIDAALAGAVRRQLVSDVPLGAFLSGGVDSPLVSATARRVSDQPLPAFTIGSNEAAFDETSDAAAYAKALDLQHHVRKFTEHDALDLVDSVVDAYGEPFADYSAFPTMMVSSLARENVKVALSGDGGDELFWGYQRFHKVLSAQPHFSRSRLTRVGRYAASRFLPGRRPPRGILFETIGDWFLDSHSGVRTARLRTIAPELTAIPSDFHLYDREETGDPQELAQWLRRNELLGHLQMVLLKVDRASMYYGLEVRVPLLDLEMVAVAARVDPRECISRGIGKQPLRAALARHVPPGLIPEPKRGFSVPLGRWLRNELRPLVEALLLDRDPYPAGMFNRSALRTYYREHLDGRRDHTRGLWTLVALQLWADRHLAAVTARRAEPVQV